MSGNKSVVGDVAKPIDTTNNTDIGAVGLSVIKDQIRNIWESLLGYSSFGEDDDLFDVGGDSVTAIQIFSEINKTFEIRIPMEKLFVASSFSVSWLAKLTEEHLIELMGRNEYMSLFEAAEV